MDTSKQMLNNLKRLISPILCWFRFPLILYKSDSSGLYLAFAGHNRDRANTWAKRILGPNYSEVSSSKVWLWQCYRACRHCPILLVETSQFNEWFLTRYKGYKVSMWNQYALDLSSGLNALKQKSFRLRNDIPRQIRKHSLNHEISHDIHDLRCYIETMHVPYIAGRHEETAFFSNPDQIEKLFARGELLYVTSENKRIAGVILDYENDMASIRYIGVLDNNSEYIRKGCIGATYYFAIKRALERGCNRFNFGGSSPFLNDGLTYFKLSFKPFIMENTYLEDHHVRMMFPANKPALVPFCRNNGFIYEKSSREWVRVIFLEASELLHRKKLKSRLKAIECKGILHTEFYIVGEEEAALDLEALLRSDDAYAIPAEFRDASVLRLENA